MARPVDHVHMGDPVPLALDQGRHEAVQGVEIGQRADRRRGGTPSARSPYPASRPSGSARARRWRCATATSCRRRPCGRPAGRPPEPTDGSSRAATSCGMKAGSFWPSPSRVTTIGAARGMDAGAHRRALAAARLVPDEAQPRPRCPGAQDLLDGRVGRAVIHIDHLEGPERRAGALDLLHQGEDVERFVLDGHHDADARARGKFSHRLRPSLATPSKGEPGLRSPSHRPRYRPAAHC